MKEDSYSFWEEYNTRLNRIIGKNLVSTREEIAKELAEFAFGLTESLKK